MINVTWFLIILIFCFGLLTGLFIGHIQLYEYVEKEIEEYKRRERADQLKSMNCESEIRYLKDDNLNVLQKVRPKGLYKYSPIGMGYQPEHGGE